MTVRFLLIFGAWLSVVALTACDQHDLAVDLGTPFFGVEVGTPMARMQVAEVTSLEQHNELFGVTKIEAASRLGFDEVAVFFHAEAKCLQAVESWASFSTKESRDRVLSSIVKWISDRYGLYDLKDTSHLKEQVGFMSASSKKMIEAYKSQYKWSLKKQEHASRSYTDINVGVFDYPATEEATGEFKIHYSAGGICAL